jgi:hypothetical protein
MTKTFSSGGLRMGRNIPARAMASSMAGGRAFNISSPLTETSFMEASYMKIVGTEVDTKSSDYLSNYEDMMKLNRELDDIVAKTVDVGQKQRDISEKRQKLLPRERIDHVLDPGTPFLEVG